MSNKNKKKLQTSVRRFSSKCAQVPREPQLRLTILSPERTHTARATTTAGTLFPPQDPFSCSALSCTITSDAIIKSTSRLGGSEIATYVPRPKALPRRQLPSWERSQERSLTTKFGFITPRYYSLSGRPLLRSYTYKAALKFI